MYYYVCIPLKMGSDFHILYTKEGVVASGFGDTENFFQKYVPEKNNATDIDGVHTLTVPSITTVTLEECPYAQIVQAYFSDSSGKIHSISTIQKGTALQEKVWHALRSIPHGETISYKELALRCGAPGAIRAIASACAKNACMIIVPCHRIVSSSGEIGKYVYGAELKKKLIIWEQRSV